MTKEDNHEHNFKYKETILQKRFDMQDKYGVMYSTGNRIDDGLWAIFVCDCGEVNKKEIN